MTQEQIYEMVRQSDLGFLLGDNWMLHHELEHFVNLVAAKEREACAKLCEDGGIIKGGEVFAAKIRARGKKT